ncbi:MAG: trypsin-like peptidase domain-containing protein [Gemmataceae bacterium]
MASQINCPNCDTALRFPEEMVGKKVRCKVCKEVFVAGGPRGPAGADEADRLQERPRPRPPALRQDEPDEDRENNRGPRRREPERPQARKAVGGPSPALVLGGAGAVLLILVGLILGLWVLSSRPHDAGGGSPAQAVAALAGGGGPPGPAVPGAAVRLRYRWLGAPVAYAVRVEVDRDDHSEIHEGTCVVRAERSNRNNPAAFAPQRGTGTGFVVSPNGVLVTCQHVVAGATKVEVALGGQRYAGTVIASDEANDLALVQVQAANLATLALANSDAAEVGQEVRAVGFPLASELGDSVKATRGTISGIDRRGTRRQLQIDANINPGNSGGPLVTETGLVVGVNNSKLVGPGVVNVGFAAPSNEVKRLLQSKNVPFSTAGGDAKLDGPTLVKRVAAATALVTVTIGPNRDGESFRLTCSGSLARRDQPKAGGGAPMFPILPRPPVFRGFAGPSTIEADSLGKVVEASGGTQLPALLGEMGQFLLDPLPDDNRESWEAVNTVTIEESSGGPGMFGPRFPRGGPGMPFGPLGMPRDNARQRQAVERSTYTRGAAGGDAVTIHKRYELKADAVGGSAGLQMTGEGQVTFDTKNGYPRGVEFRATLVQTTGNTTRRQPVVVSYKLLEGEQREKAVNPPAPPPLKPATEGDLPTLLADAREKKWPAVEKLAEMAPVEARRAEVVTVLTELLAEKDVFVRRAATKALGTWGEGGKESGLAVVRLVDDDDVFVRQAAIDAVAKLKDERGVEPVAKRLGDGFTRMQAGKALRAFGAKAEKAVAGVLDGGDWVAKSEACQVLKDIGTPRSKAALEKAAGDANPHVARMAKEALSAIAARK